MLTHEGESNSSEDHEQTIGELLREARVECDTTLREFSEKVGIDVSYISKMERGEMRPSIRLIEGYIKEFGLARFYAYEKAGYIKTDLNSGSFELIQDWFNEGNIVLSE